MFICAKTVNEIVSVNLWEGDLIVQGLDVGGRHFPFCISLNYLN